jgi:hypothetical protein
MKTFLDHFPLHQDNGEPVPETVAKMGVYLHWVADRASHWYCTDSSESGIMGVKKSDKEYDLYMWLGAAEGCNFVTHGMAHYWVCTVIMVMICTNKIIGPTISAPVRLAAFRFMR